MKNITFTLADDFYLKDILARELKELGYTLLQFTSYSDVVANDSFCALVKTNDEISQFCLIGRLKICNLPTEWNGFYTTEDLDLASAKFDQIQNEESPILLILSVRNGTKKLNMTRLFMLLGIMENDTSYIRQRNTIENIINYIKNPELTVAEAFADTKYALSNIQTNVPY
jgi:hypothetical protein